MKPFSWIKLSTEFFEDPKVLRLQTYPEKDFLLIFWIKLVLLSLRRNDGLLLIDDTLPYSVSDFVSLFRKEENVVRMALSIFEKLKMIEVNPSDGGEIIGIREFVGFSDVEELDDARRKNREKQAAFRKRQKSALLAIRESKNEDSSEDPKDVTGYSPGTNQNFEVSNQKVTDQNKNREEEEKGGDITPTPPPPPPKWADGSLERIHGILEPIPGRMKQILLQQIQIQNQTTRSRTVKRLLPMQSGTLPPPILKILVRTKSQGRRIPVPPRETGPSPVKKRGRRIPVPPIRKNRSKSLPG